jgi:hypothetical protein
LNIYIYMWFIKHKEYYLGYIKCCLGVSYRLWTQLRYYEDFRY